MSFLQPGSKFKQIDNCRNDTQSLRIEIFHHPIIIHRHCNDAIKEIKSKNSNNTRLVCKTRV